MPYSRLPTTLQAAYSELVQMAHDDAITAAASAGGAIISKIVKGRKYWYRQENGARRRQIYLGPDEPGVEERLNAMRAAHEAAQAKARTRRTLVAALVSAGYPESDRTAARVLTRMSEKSVFRLGAVLIGTHAFRCYGPMLGAAFEAACAVTNDVDLAHDPDRNRTSEKTESISEILGGLDELFDPDPTMNSQGGICRWALRNSPQRFVVELLTPQSGTDGKLQIVPGLSSTAKPLQDLEYLIQDPVRSVVLTGSGVPVTVPHPARYACHKLIVAQVRGEQDKVAKDLSQARSLCEVLADDRPGILEDAFVDLLARGPKWRRAAADSIASFPSGLRAFFLDLGKERPDFTERASRHGRISRSTNSSLPGPGFN